jgi:glycine betaine transporter
MAESTPPQVTRKERPFDPLIFGVSATLTLLFFLWSAVFPESIETIVNTVFSWTTEKWGWLYLWTAFLLVGASIVLLGTRFGAMTLGKPGGRPAFSNFAGYAMLFGSAVAASIVFWESPGPAYHYTSPLPYFGGEPKTPVAAANAMTYSFFHWGLSA